MISMKIQPVLLTVLGSSKEVLVDAIVPGFKLRVPAVNNSIVSVNKFEKPPLELISAIMEFERQRPSGNRHNHFLDEPYLVQLKNGQEVIIIRTDPYSEGTFITHDQRFSVNLAEITGPEETLIALKKYC